MVAGEVEVVAVSNSRSGRPADRYGSDQIRPGLLPGLLGSAAAIAGLWASGTEWMITVLFAVSILSAILFFFCVTAFRAQGKSRRPAVALTFAILLVIIVVVYNPVAPFVLTASGTGWQLVQVATGAILFAAGVVVKTPAPQR